MLSVDPVALLQELIRRPSVTPAEAGVFDVLEPVLVSLGFTVSRHRFEGDGSYPVDNLFATRGSGGRHLLFCGHTDVVPPGDRALWSHDPFGGEKSDGNIWGRGAADMKSGIAAFVAAVAAAGETGGRLSLAITNDEEQDSINGADKLLAWAAKQGHTFDFAIVGEPSASQRAGDSIKIGRRGSFSGRIAVIGVQGHVAYPERAKNPLPVLAALVSALKSTPLDNGTERFPPTNLEVTSIDTGNDAGNVIPARGVARFNIRFNDRWSPETLAGWVRDRLASVDAQGCAVDFTEVARHANAFLSPLGGGADLLVETITEMNGVPPELSTAGGTSDARFVARYCPVVECGLPGQTMHKADEHINIGDLNDLTELYRRFITAYLR